MSYCPKCEQRGRVIDSRPDPLTQAIRRRHLCACGERWTTVEVEERRYSKHVKSTRVLLELQNTINQLTSKD